MPLPPYSVVVSAARVIAAAAGPAPSRLTVDQLRSDLSHETAAKLARFAGLLREWRAGNDQPDDSQDAAVIVRDIGRLHLRHARVACGSLHSFAQLVRVLTLTQEMGKGASSMCAKRTSRASALTRIEHHLTELKAASHQLVESLSDRYGARFGELVGAAAEEIRREAAAANVQGVSVIIDSADGGAAAWIPRADAARWSDLVRNLIRNAVQATEERGGPGRDVTTNQRADLNLQPAVVVRLRPAPGRGGACVEIIDEGVGMEAAQVEAMWGDGRSRHGEGHGQGLTEAKRAFLEQRAAFEVRSVPQVGTCVRIELPPRDITFRVPRRWASPPLVLPAAALLAFLIFAGAQARHTEMVSVEVVGGRLATGLDRRGHILWKQDVPGGVEANRRSTVQLSNAELPEKVPPLVVRDGANARSVAILVATTPGRILALDSRGHEMWSKPLTWIPPRDVHTGNLTAVFQAASVWNVNDRPAIVLNVRDGVWSPTSIQFFSLAGDPLGAYHHPGHLEFVISGDVDGDGRVELVLSGKNNAATHNTAFWPDDAGPQAYAECLVLLETPHVNGQAFPYSRWDDLPPAREEAYLLIPPLRPEDIADPQATAVDYLFLGPPGPAGEVRSELFIHDGRIYTLDRHFRPISCAVGDHTLASRIAPTRPAAPLLYFREGKPESIDLIIQREP